MAARLEVTLFRYRPHWFCCVDQVVLMLTSFHLNKKSREVCIKVRSPSASLASRGQVTKHRTVKWPIAEDAAQRGRVEGIQYDASGSHHTTHVGPRSTA